MGRPVAGMLWRLEHPAAPGPSWLFGTMHVRDRRAFAQLAQVKDRIHRCELFATEFRLDDMAHPPRREDILLPEGQTLSQLMGRPAFAKLRRILQKAVGLDIEPLQRFKPLIVLNLADERMLARDTLASLDETLYHYARSAGKTLHGIETYDEQLRLIADIPLDDQLKALRGLGRNIRNHRRGLRRMADRYARGDLPALYRSVRSGARHLRRPLLYHRNAVMAERTADLLLDHTAVVALGAGHLWGGKGVLRGLKRRGFSTHPDG